MENGCLADAQRYRGSASEQIMYARCLFFLVALRFYFTFVQIEGRLLFSLLISRFVSTWREERIKKKGDEL